VDEHTDRFPSTATLVRVALVLFVLAWIFGPYALRQAVPIWVVFVVALGLELQFFVGALRGGPRIRPDRGPQEIDRERYGYVDEDEELVVVDGGRGRALRRFLVGVAVIAALVLALRFAESRTGWDSLSRETRIEASERFSVEASRIAQKPVTVFCDESRDYVGAVQHADGVAEVGGDHTYLTPERCHDLYRLAFEGRVTGSETGRAIAVLAHESWHLRGVVDEGTTECYALQSGVEVGRRLGLTDERAQQLMRQQLTENALRSRGSFEYLVPPACRDGGRLDLDAGSGRFP